MFLFRPGAPVPPSITPFVEAARSFLAAASLPVLDEQSLPDASGFRVLPYNATAVLVSPVVDGQATAPAGAQFRTGALREWENLGRSAHDVVTAEGWARIAHTWDGAAYSPPVGTLHPLVKETLHVLERDGDTGYAAFDVSLLDSGAVRIDVAGGYNCRELSLSDVAGPALSAAGFESETFDVDGEISRTWGTAHHLVVRPPTERREEWALAHTVRRFLQAERRHVGWGVHMTPAQPDDLPEDAAPGAHLGALRYQFDGHAVHDPRAFDYTLRQAGYVLTPTRHAWWHNIRILRRAD
ncbi:hypothetical protein [Streptomyces microflavus]|uniref:hypothetical protein n=1 Tax=Streptomyces microflavus TaxID=1919 RepID=UPI00364C172F